MTEGSHGRARHANVGEEPLSAMPLGSVFRLPRRHGLPLHVSRRVRASALMHVVVQRKLG